MIEWYEDQISFTYSQERTKPQMFFSVNLAASDIAGKNRRTDTIVLCTKTLCNECEKYDFSLQSFNKDGDDLTYSYE